MGGRRPVNMTQRLRTLLLALALTAIPAEAFKLSPEGSFIEEAGQPRAR
jgi:hypothetical protein